MILFIYVVLYASWRYFCCVHVPLFMEAVVHYGIVIGSKFENRKNGDERGQSVR